MAASSASPTVLRRMMTDGIMLHYVMFSVSDFRQLLNFSVITVLTMCDPRQDGFVLRHVCDLRFVATSTVCIITDGNVC